LGADHLAGVRRSEAGEVSSRDAVHQLLDRDRRDVAAFINDHPAGPSEVDVLSAMTNWIIARSTPVADTARPDEPTSPGSMPRNRFSLLDQHFSSGWR
jgi:hypothetical protein